MLAFGLEARVSATWPGRSNVPADRKGRAEEGDGLEATATRGRTFTYRTVEIYDIRDGKIAERWAFSDDTAAIVEFFA